MEIERVGAPPLGEALAIAVANGELRGREVYPMETLEGKIILTVSLIMCVVGGVLWGWTDGNAEVKAAGQALVVVGALVCTGGILDSLGRYLLSAIR